MKMGRYLPIFSGETSNLRGRVRICVRVCVCAKERGEIKRERESKSVYVTERDRERESKIIHFLDRQISKHFCHTSIQSQTK